MEVNAELDAFEDVSDRVSPSVEFRNAACDADLEGPEQSPERVEVGDGYHTFTVTGTLSPEVLIARAPVSHGTLWVWWPTS